MDMNEMKNFTEILHRCIEYRNWFLELKKKYDEMQNKYAELQDKHTELQDEYTELQNSFEESQDGLASANAELQRHKDANNHLANNLKRQLNTVSELKEELRQTRIRLDEVEEARDNWKTEAIRRQKENLNSLYGITVAHIVRDLNELNDIKMRNLMREKPMQECCEYCNKTDCSDCAICPF